MTPEQHALLEDKAALWRRQSTEGNMEMRDYYRRCADAMDAALSLAGTGGTGAEGWREALFNAEPSMGYSTAEPSLRVIVERYYGAHFPADEAAAFAAQYFAALSTTLGEQS